MRITNPTIVRNYSQNLNSNLGKLNAANNRITTQRNFSSMAENTSFGVRAMQLRRALDNVTSYKDTAKTMQSQYKSAEDHMMNVVDLGKDVYIRYENALNSTNGEDELKVFAAEIKQFRDQMLVCANGRFSDRFLFGGTNTTSTPFTASDDGLTLYYNGVNVADIADSEGNVKPEYQYLFDDSYYSDIGLGLKEDESGLLVKTSAFKSSLNGLDFLGYGEDNIYLVCNQLIAAMEDPNFREDRPYDTKYDKLLNKIQDSYKNVTLSITELGAQSQYLEYTVERLDNERINLIERQDAIEFVDPADAIMEFKMQEYVYNAALQMGQRLLQPTLFSFIS